MQTLSENSPRLPLFRLIVLGVTLSFWNTPGQAFAEDHPLREQATHGSRVAKPRMPEAFPDFSPDDPAGCQALAPQANHETSRFESRLFALPLPPDLTPEQQKAALALMREAEPYLTVIHMQLRQTLTELHNLSFASDTPPDALAVIGRKLIHLRAEALRELQHLSSQMEKIAGFNPGWGVRVRGTKIEDLNPQSVETQDQ